jgi:DNA polymerase III subunit beta
MKYTNIMEVIMKTLAHELKGKYSEKEIKELIKLLTPKKVAATKVKDYTKLLNFVADTKNKIRPAINNVLCKDGKMIATDLELSVIINTEIEKEGLYSIKQLQNKAYSISGDIEEYPIIKEITGTEVKLSGLKSAIDKLLFMLPDNDENLAINGIRFDNDKIVSTNTYSMVMHDYTSNLQLTLPKRTCQALSKAFDDGEVYITYTDDGVMLKQGNITLISRLITLDFAPYKNILEYLETPNTLRVNTEDLTNALTELLPIAKDNENALNSAIFKVENNKLTISAISSTMKKELDMICLCNLDKFKISLNIKWLLDYIKTSDKIEVEIQFKDDSSGLMINNEYLAMPLAMREE